MWKDLSALISLTINIVMLGYCIKKFRSNPLSFDVVVYLLYFVFYYIPLLDYLYNWGLFSNSLLRINGYFGSEKIAIKYNYISLIIMCTFVLGFRTSIIYRKKNVQIKYKQNTFDFSINRKTVLVIKIVLFLVLALVMFSAIRNYQYGIKNFFTMARKDAYSGTFQTTIVSIVPTLLIGLEYIDEIKSYGKIKWKLLLYIGLAILAILTKGQRREIINEIIFVALLFMHAISNRYYSLDKKKANRKIRKYIVILGILIVILIPTTWYLRAYATRAQYGRFVNPFQYYGWLELLFGSSSTGFQTSIIMDGYEKDYGFPFLNSIRLMLSYFIPRSILKTKPMVLTRYIQQGLNTSGNLSVFYINDVWFNFYQFSPIISFIIGTIISKILKDIDGEKNLFSRITKFFAFSNVITLFKNGYTSFFFSLIVFWIVWVIIEKCVVVKLDKGDN